MSLAKILKLADQSDSDGNLLRADALFWVCVQGSKFEGELSKYLKGKRPKTFDRWPHRPSLLIKGATRMTEPQEIVFSKEEKPFVEDCEKCDLTACRMYADWLEERGDPRGEFLNLYLTLGETVVDSDRWNQIQTRMYDEMIENKELTDVLLKFMWWMQKNGIIDAILDQERVYGVVKQLAKSESNESQEGG